MPFMDTTGAASASVANVGALLPLLDKAGHGGLMSTARTPVGCTLMNAGAPVPKHSAYHYMKQVKETDRLPCRANHVLLITDGQANGPGDVDGNYNFICATAACAAANPRASGCRCASVLAAQALREDLGVRTYVVRFAKDVSAGHRASSTTTSPAPAAPAPLSSLTTRRRSAA